MVGGAAIRAPDFCRMMEKDLRPTTVPTRGTSETQRVTMKWPRPLPC